ncbi:hypothetical protein AaE_002992 [Aphanomyces astaci]|uniref:DDE Tnp4 domain-containing protein n=1 Tax=Aphanomyces astaci TaxID=112090 RepID=A0A6A5A8C1_APHAT|nr:hypothetical protein AaE_002992 [Aphanomyces astaci]
MPPRATHRSQLTVRNINQGVARLESLDQQRRAKRARYMYSTVREDEPDDDLESASPVFDAFFNARGTDGIMTMTNFSPSEFNVLWADIRLYVNKSWNVGSGRKCEVSNRDMLFMLLTTMKTGGSWDIVATIFKEASPTFQKRVMYFVRVLHPFVMRKYVNALTDKWTMLLLSTSGQRFANYPYARYATDVTFQQTNVPSAMPTRRFELSVLPNGFAINCTKHYKGSVSDKTIFDENLDFHMASLTKQANEDRIDDPDHATRQWAVLADKGYQGIQRDLRAVIPIKKPAGESSRWTTYVPTTA